MLLVQNNWKIMKDEKERRNKYIDYSKYVNNNNNNNKRIKE